MAYSTVKLTALEKALGWSDKWPEEARLEYGRRSRPRAQVPTGWVPPVRYWHYAFRDGMKAIDAYLAGASDTFPATEIREIGWLLTSGREIGGAPLRFDARNCLRICEVVALVFAIDAMFHERKTHGSGTTNATQHDVDGQHERREQR